MLGPKLMDDFVVLQQEITKLCKYFLVFLRKFTLIFVNNGLVNASI
jgi:hypothetical protein